MPGTVTISIELELAWGSHDKQQYNHLSTDGSAEREGLQFVLDACSKYNIPISFNIIGHLFHETCQGSHTGPYDDDWWAQDPGTDSRTNPLFYSPTLVQRIVDSDIEHEVATHTYSHILCETSPEGLLDHELRAVRCCHQDLGIATPVSIVTPRHQEPSYEVLRENDIEVIRTPSDAQPPDFRQKFGKIGTLLWATWRKNPVSELTEKAGIVESKCTSAPSLTSPTLPQGQSKPHSFWQYIPARARQKYHARYLRSEINRTAKTEGHIHFWTHIYNLSNQLQEAPVREGLRYLSQQRNKGLIRIKRMCDLPELITN